MPCEKEGENIVENASMKKIVTSEVKPSKWKIVKQSNGILLSDVRKENTKLKNILNELQKFSVEQSNEEIVRINFRNFIPVTRKYLSKYLSQAEFHYFIIALVITDIIVVFVDLILGLFKEIHHLLNRRFFPLAQLSSPCLTDDEMLYYNTTDQRDSCLLPLSSSLLRGETFLFYLSLILLMIFVIDVVVSFYAFGWQHYRNPLYLMDGIIVVSSFVMEIYFHYGNIGRAGRAAAAMVVLRLWKIVRAIHAVAHSITVKNHLLIKKIREAQTAIEEDKLNAEQIMEKQEIKLEYLINILKTSGKSPNLLQIDNYVEQTYQERKTMK